MTLSVIVQLCALLTISQQAASLPNCVCDLTSSEQPFPHDKLSSVEDGAAKCTGSITRQKSVELDSLLLGLQRRLPQLEADMSVLEREDDGELYGAVSLQVIENELVEILQLMNKLNSTTLAHSRLTSDTAQQVQDLKVEMQQLEVYDSMQVVKSQQDNQRLKEDLDLCRKGHHPTTQPMQPPSGICPHGHFLNVTGPRVYTAGEYPGSYKYGSWGRDPKPEAGKENWYWLVMLTTSNIHANNVRRYSSLSSLIVGVSVPGNVQIHSSNPTTNTIQGPSAVLYGEALYYGCYNRDAVCRFNLTTKSVTSVQLPKGTRFNSKGNFCHLDECYPYTDLDLSTDESGVWVIYTTSQDFGNLVVSRVEEGETPTINQTWHTSLYKQAATNTFMACGVLYATRYVSKDVEEIFYSFDTSTGVERFDIGIQIQKMSGNIYSLNYSPPDQMLHAYSESYMVSYKVVFG
ncbi:olfactomedin-4-like [Centroberyx affinis]|uniref:olfactomedin-4-like n=1 Tax=Centroberyx affinis TaxID=166261 RepID=UPI003A5C34FD